MLNDVRTYLVITASEAQQLGKYFMFVWPDLCDPWGRDQVFAAPLRKSKSAVLWHHGHHDCVCPVPFRPLTGHLIACFLPDFAFNRLDPAGLSGTKGKTRQYGVRPGWAQDRCREGCTGAKHTKKMASNGTGFTWWDLDNVTRFFHRLGHNVAWHKTHSATLRCVQLCPLRV